MININYFLAGFIGSMIGALISYLIKRKTKMQKKCYLNLLKETCFLADRCYERLHLISDGIFIQELKIRAILDSFNYSQNFHDPLKLKFDMQIRSLVEIHQKTLLVIEDLEYIRKLTNIIC